MLGIRIHFLWCTFPTYKTFKLIFLALQIFPKDLAAYGYGSVAWKERFEAWKKEKEKLQLVKSDSDSEEVYSDALDLPL